VQQLVCRDLRDATRRHQFGDGAGVQAGHGVGGVGQQDPSDAVVAAPGQQPVALGAAEMAGGQDGVVVGDQRQHEVGRRLRLGIDRRHGQYRTTKPTFYVAQSRQTGPLLSVGVRGRHPDDTTAGLKRGRHGGRVDPSGAAVEGDAPDDVETRLPGQAVGATDG